MDRLAGGRCSGDVHSIEHQEDVTPMFTIAGSTGQVGGATARNLAGAGHAVRLLARDPSRSAGALPGALAGPAVAQADLTDRASLAAALGGSRGCFLLLPFDPKGTDVADHQARMVDAITGAVADAQVPHVVVLSSLGADTADGPGILRWLHALEDGLRSTAAVVSTVRSTSFQEKVGEVLEAAHEGVYPVFGDDVDTPVPLVATADVGATVAATLLAPPQTNEVIDVLGPTYSERELAAAVGEALGATLAVTPVPRPAWEGTLTSAGLSAEAADLVAELYDAANRGLLRPVGDRHVVGETPIETTLERLL
jgi:uncharacterized protein YbjT (DUF2867 family)